MTRRPIATGFLDGIRGLAAFEVLLGHACIFLLANYKVYDLAHSRDFSPVAKCILLTTRLGHVAVIVFFVLSGFVIHLRYAKRLQLEPGETAFGYKSFFIRRAKRLYPPLIFAIAVTYFFDRLGMARGYSIYSATTHDPFRYDWKTLIGNLAFVMRAYVPMWGSDDALWSLRFEWWFYVLYALYWPVLRRSLFATTSIVAVLFALSFFNGPWHFIPAEVLFREVVAGMLTWWLGVLLAEMHSGRLAPRFGWTSFFSLLIPLLLYREMIHQPLPDVFWGLGFAGLLSLGFWWQQVGGFLRPLERLKWLGDMSYTLYVVHFPILVFMSGWVISRSANGQLPRHFGWVLFSIAVILPFSFVAHYVVERPFIRIHRRDRVSPEDSR